MRKDPIAYSNLFNLLAVLSLVTPVVGVLAAGPQVDPGGRAIAFSAGLWLAALWRTAAVSFDPSPRTGGNPALRTRTRLAPPLDARPALGAVGVPE